jgi:RNA recognition motif-containing protein
MGPLYDGREVYVSNVDWNGTEDELRQTFSKYGLVERVRIPKNVAGNSKGVAFIVFSSKVGRALVKVNSVVADVFGRKRLL